MFSYIWLRHLVQQASYSKTKCRVSNTVGLLTVVGKKVLKTKTGCVVIINGNCVLDTLNQKLKSLCAHSIAASMKSFDWQCSEWTLWWWRPLIGQIISQSAKNSRRHLILSVLCGKSACRNIIPTAFFFCHRVHFCMHLLYTRKNVEGHKHTASEDEVVVQATRAAHMGPNKTGNIWNAPKQTQNQTLRSDITASRRWGHF